MNDQLKNDILSLADYNMMDGDLQNFLEDLWENGGQELTDDEVEFLNENSTILNEDTQNKFDELIKKECMCQNQTNIYAVAFRVRQSCQ